MKTIQPAAVEERTAEILSTAQGFFKSDTCRYSDIELVNSRLKDEFGGRFVRVRGHAKVRRHLMFGILTLTANQMMIWVT